MSAQVHIDGIAYPYKVGRLGTVKVRMPNGKTIIGGVLEVTGRTPDTVQRGYCKQTSDAWVLPSDVRRWLIAAIAPKVKK